MVKKLKLKDGTYVPGATTIIGLLDKPFLVPWANKLGKQGIDSTEYTNKAARKGTLVHEIIESNVMRTEVLLESYSDAEIEEVLPHLEYFKNWKLKHSFEPLWCEQAYVSENYKFGGIVDCYAIVDDKYTIIDFKTSKRISKEYYLQLSSYVELLRENGLQVDQIMVINVGKNPEDVFQEGSMLAEDTKDYFKLFKALLDVYWIQKEIKWKD